MAETLPLIGSGIALELLCSSPKDDYRLRKVCIAARKKTAEDHAADYPSLTMKLLEKIPQLFGAPVLKKLTSHASIDIAIKTGVAEEEMEAIAPCARGMVLRLSRPGAAKDVLVTQSNAILRTIATMKPDSSLYGRTEFDSAQVDQWLETCWNEFEVPVEALSAASGNQVLIGEAKRHILAFLAAANACLSTRTFLASERPTIADIALVCASRDVFETPLGMMGPKDLAAIPHVLRWYRTMTHLPAVVAVWPLEAKGDSVPPAPEKPSKKGKGAPAGAGAGAGAPAASTARSLGTSAPSNKAASCATGSGAAGGVPLEEAVPVLGASGDVKTTASVVQGARKLDLVPAKFKRKRIRVKELLSSGKTLVGQKAVVKGWLRTARSASKGALLFLVLDDGSCPGTAQVVVDKTAPGFEAALNCGGVGASVSVTGEVVASKGKGQEVEIRADEVEVLGRVLEPDGSVGASTYPLAKKAHSQEFLRSIAHLRPRTKMHSAAMRVRHAMAFASHKFFNDRGFLYIQTPVITSADCEGAGEQFAVSTLLPEGPATPAAGAIANGHVSDAPPMTPSGHVDYTKDFFSRRTCLTVSGQLNVETHCCALGDVYTFGPTFRAENSHTSRHLAEFWMIEPEIAFADLGDVIDLAEDYLKYLVAYALAHCEGDLEFFETCPGGEPGLRERLRNVLHNDFVRLTYTELVELVRRDAKAGKVHFTVLPEWGDDLGSEHERYVAEKVYNAPCIVTDYPKDIKAFYMKQNKDGKTVAAMDVLVPKIGELMGGSQREDELDKLATRATAMGLPEESISWYLDLRRYGTIQHGGFGLGFERLVMFATGIENIRDVIPFPRFPGHAEF